MPSVTMLPDGEVPPEGGGAAPARPAAKSPSQKIVQEGTEVLYCTDSKGREIGWRKLDALEDFDLTYLAGDASSNEQWMWRASVAYGVRSIAGEEVRRPATRNELRALVKRLGNEGFVAIMAMVQASLVDEEADADPSAVPGAAPMAPGIARAKNSQGTPDSD